MEGKTKAFSGIEFELAGRSSYLRVDLEAILHNIQTLKNRCSAHTDVIAVIKANAYGHGSVALARYLHSKGFQHFAVATAYEGQELRQAGVQGFIQVLGNCMREEVAMLRQYQLTPTATTVDFLRQWGAWPEPKWLKTPAVVIKIDSGMSRNGCQPEELPSLMQLCEEIGIPVHSLMTHFAQSWDDDDFTQQQLSTFLAAVKPYRNKGVKLHAANSAAIIHGFATDLDFVRPGVCLYGLPPDSSLETAREIQDLQLRPALCWIAHPTMVKRLQPGRVVGYNQTYRLDKEETIATFSVGYADGYNRHLSSQGILTTMDGEQQHVVGRVSMDAITVKVKEGTTMDTPFYVYTNSLTGANSVTTVARTLDTIPDEIGTNLAHRLPRVYLVGTSLFTADGKMAYLADADMQGTNNGQGFTALVAMVFPDQKTGAFATYHTSKATAFTVTFILARFLCLYQRLYLSLTLSVLGLIGYGVVEIMLQRRKESEDPIPCNVVVSSGDGNDRNLQGSRCSDNDRFKKIKSP